MDGWMAGKEIYLGYTYQIGGEKLEVPLFELPEHYEEVDEPIVEEVIIDETTSLEPEERQQEEDVLTEEPNFQRVTLSDYRVLEEKVKMMMNMLGLDSSHP